MQEVLTDLRRWLEDGKRAALGTVVKVWGSAPRQSGSKLVVSSAGDISGSVSNGCVEGAVIEEAREVMQSGTPRLLHFGVTNEEAWAVGLTCGGEIEVLVEPVVDDEAWQQLVRSIEAEEPVVTARFLGKSDGVRQLVVRPDGSTAGSLGSEHMDAAATSRGQELLADMTSVRTVVEAGGESADLFFDVTAPQPRLVLIGAGHVAIPLVAMANAMGFHTIVVDPRTAFAAPERFRHADELIPEWPQEALARVPITRNTCVAVLSHDLKLDVPALEIVLRSPARYVGALGSKRTHAKRIAALEEKGLSDGEIARIHAPIGLDLGGRKPEEIALSILAQIVADGHGK